MFAHNFVNLCEVDHDVYGVLMLLYRIYVDLPDEKNRMKILSIFLAQENLEPNLQLQELAHATEGYSGSDLKVVV